MALFRAGLTAALVSFSIHAKAAFAQADTGDDEPSRPPASAGVTATDTHFTLPASCGSENEFRSELERLAGAHAAQAYPLTLSISEIAGSDPGARFHLVLELRGERRELTHADCRALFRGAVVIAAASVKPPPAPPPVPAARAEPAPVVSNPPRRAERPLAMRGSVSLGAGAALGVVPGAAAMLELRAGLDLGRWGISLAGNFLPAKHATQDGRGVDVLAVGGRLAGGVRPVRPLMLSAGIELDWLQGTGDAGISERRTDSAWSVAPSLELAVIPFETNHLHIELAAQGRLALLRPRFVVTGFRDVYRVPSFGGAGLVRGAFTFP